MNECKIMLDLDNANEFVQKASKCDFDIDIFYNHFIIDAKSLLGVLGLDFSKILTVKYGGENTDFSSMLKQLAVG
ncbi:MAG: HPr family phosphocarrier protein [Lachnospiraceae bacterium]|nr:HPr family phosphocarrier protein [Lachnospiraceae bacterium]